MAYQESTAARWCARAEIRPARNRIVSALPPAGSRSHRPRLATGRVFTRVRVARQEARWTTSFFLELVSYRQCIRPRKAPRRDLWWARWRRQRRDVSRRHRQQSNRGGGGGQAYRMKRRPCARVLVVRRAANCCAGARAQGRSANRGLQPAARRRAAAVPLVDNAQDRVRSNELRVTQELISHARRPPRKPSQWPREAAGRRPDPLPRGHRSSIGRVSKPSASATRSSAPIMAAP